LELPPVVTHMPSIFQVLYVDTMHIAPPSNSCSYLVHGRCALSSWMESCALRKENARSIGQWLFEDIILIEQLHWDMRQMLYKATNGDVKKWYWFLHYVMWANRITIRKGTGCSPYFMITSTHPTLPLDIQEVTWLVNYPGKMMSTEDLIGLRATALAKHVEHVEAMHLRANKKKLA
ncbi:hypothetical protein AN958_10062, partial [Leucoagaricus sp. SymC.cos]